MNWDAIGATGEIGGAVAVVATLFYLAVQIRQNGLQQRSENLRALTDESNRIISVMYDLEVAGALVRSFADWETASAQDKNIASVFLLQYCQFVQNTFWMFESKAIDKTVYSPSRSMWLGVLANPGALVWWEMFQNVFDKRFVKQVNLRLLDDRILASTESISFWNLQHWKNWPSSD